MLISLGSALCWIGAITCGLYALAAALVAQDFERRDGRFHPVPMGFAYLLLAISLVLAHLA